MTSAKCERICLDMQEDRTVKWIHFLNVPLTIPIPKLTASSNTVTEGTAMWTPLDRSVPSCPSIAEIWSHLPSESCVRSWEARASQTRGGCSSARQEARPSSTSSELRCWEREEELGISDATYLVCTRCIDVKCYWWEHDDEEGKVRWVGQRVESGVKIAG